MATAENAQKTNGHQSLQHKEPEKPLVYEPPDLRGRKHVEKVTGEYRVREDEVLADKLQNEEFDFHYGKNKDERQRGHMDVKTAKSIYIREVEESGLLSKAEVRRLMMNDINPRLSECTISCVDDGFIAKEVSRRLQEEIDLDAQKKAASEMQDEEFARYLEAKEKEKLELERKRRLERRIAQDRAAAKRLQRELENRDGATSGNDADAVVPTSQKGGWAIDFEVGTSTGEKTRHDLQELKDAEIVRQLQLTEAEQEQRRLEEERDRKIAMKLHLREEEAYRREKKERQLRRERQQSQLSHTSTSTEGEEEQHPVSEIRTKQLHSVDATGKPVRRETVAGTRHRGEMQETPQRRASESHRKERQLSNKQKSVEPVYLQAVDATGSPVASKNGRVKMTETRLVDDQRALQQQMRHVDHMQPIGADRPRERTDSKKQSTKHSQPTNTRGLETRSSADRRTEQQYDTPENRHYNNVAATIDPTYTSIDSLKRGEILPNSVDEQGNVRPAPVIQNVKRASNSEENKKKKKWFSKKEKS